MKGNGFRNDESGVSPVIGVVLMVAITVLLASTVAAFVFGFDDKAANAQSPTVALGFDYESGGSDHDALVVKHQSGEAVAVDNLYLQIDGAKCTGGGTAPDGRYNVGSEYGGLPAELKAGMTVLVDEDSPASDACDGGTLDLSGARISVVWQSHGGTSTTLQTWQK